MNRVCQATLLALTALLAAVSCEKKNQPEKLAAPSPVLATAGINSATFLWENVKRAESYLVVLDEGETIPVKGISITVDGLEPASEHTLKMKSIAPEGSLEWLDSDFSVPLNFSTAGKKKLSMPDLSASCILPSGFTVSWPVVRNAAKYVYKIGEGEEIQTVETAFTVDNLINSTHYTVKVKAVPSEEMSEVATESQWAELVVTTAGPAALDAPVLRAESVLGVEITIAWDAIHHAQSYVCTLNDGEPVSVTTNFVKFEGLQPLTQYTVKVYSKPAEGDVNYYDSPVSKISVTTKNAPSEDDKKGDLPDFEEKPIF